MTLVLPPARRLQAALVAAAPLVLLVAVWTCRRPAPERAPDAQAPGAPLGPVAAARGAPVVAVDPCAEALRLGLATEVDAEGRPKAAAPGRTGFAGAGGGEAGSSGAGSSRVGNGPASGPNGGAAAAKLAAPRLWIASGRAGSGAIAGATKVSVGGATGRRAAPRGRGAAGPGRVEIQLLEQPGGGCLEVFVEGRLRGRISTRTHARATGTGRAAGAPPPKGLRRVLTWPLPGPGDPAAAEGPSRAAPPGGTDAPSRAAPPGGTDAPSRAAPRGATRPRRSAPGRAYAVWEVALAAGERHVELRAAGKGTVRLFGLEQRSGRPGVLVSNVGVSGAQVASVLPGYADLIDRQIRRLDPALVAVMLGTNDAYDLQLTPERFEARLTALLRRLRRAPAPPDCLVLAAPDFGDRHWRTARKLRRQAARIRAVQRRVAAAERCAFFDLYAAMGGAGSMSRFMRAHPPFAWRDHVHLTPRGYRALGLLLHEALMQRYAAYLKRRPRLKVAPPDPAAGRTAEELRDEAEARRRWPSGVGPVALENGDGRTLGRLFRALVLLARRAPRAEARVLFLGDSHVAGDHLAGELRARLQRAFGDAGHGFVHAGTPWPGYARRGLRLGAAGPWSYYYLRTRSHADQPGDGLYGLGGISTWFTEPPPGLPSARRTRPAAPPRVARAGDAPPGAREPSGPPGGLDAAAPPEAAVPRLAPHPPPDHGD